MPTPEQSYGGTDFYCDVAIPHSELLDVVIETDDVLAFHHTRPHWPTHVVVTPKRHVRSLTTLTAVDEPLVRAVLSVVQEVAAEVERRDGACAVVTDLGRYQDSHHLHVHVTSGEPLT